MSAPDLSRPRLSQVLEGGDPAATPANATAIASSLIFSSKAYTSVAADASNHEHTPVLVSDNKIIRQTADGSKISNILARFESRQVAERKLCGKEGQHPRFDPVSNPTRMGPFVGFDEWSDENTLQNKNNVSEMPVPG